MSWMRPYWICLAGTQTLPNVVPILAYKPERVLLLHTRFSKEASNRTASFLQKREIQTTQFLVDAFKADKTRAIIRKAIDDHGVETLLLNWTGGTKPMAAAALAASGESMPTIYYDPRLGLMIDQKRFEKVPGSGNLSLGELIELNSSARLTKVGEGAQWSNSSSALAKAYRSGKHAPYKLDSCMFKYRKRIWDRIHNGPNRLKVPDGTLPQPEMEGHPVFGAELEHAMRKDGLLVGKGFRPNLAGIEFLHGKWLEGLTALLLKEMMESKQIDVQIHCSFEIEWPIVGMKRRTAPKIPSKNEIDLGFVMNGRLYIVSCTTGGEGILEDHRHEVESLTERLGGTFARPVLVATFSSSENQFLRVNARKKRTTIMPPFHDLGNANRLYSMLLPNSDIG